MANAVILMGLPGSGKTTYVSKYLGAYSYVSADNYHIDADGEYRYKPEFAGQAHAACKREFALWACGEGPSGNIVVDNTNVELHTIAFYIECAMAFDHTVQVLLLHSQDAYYRQTHGVPLNTWLAMASRAKSAIMSWPERWPNPIVIRT